MKVEWNTYMYGIYEKFCLQNWNAIPKQNNCLDIKNSMRNRYSR